MVSILMLALPETITALEASTAALTASVTALSDDQIAQPCLLPGWTRGHLITHLAQNAVGLSNLVLAARTGAPLRMYASALSRDENIRAGATRRPVVIVENYSLTSHVLAAQIRHLPEAAWNNVVTFHTTTGARESAASAILGMRLREVEIHHVDLDVGYDFSSTDPRTVHELLTYAVERQGPLFATGLSFTATDTGHTYAVGSQLAEAPVEVAATGPALLRYLTGRGDVDPALADLAPAPPWG